MGEMAPYSLTEVNDKTFTLTFSAPFVLGWLDQRIKLDNLTQSELSAIAPKLKNKIWQPDVMISNLKSADAVSFLSQKTTSKLLQQALLLNVKCATHYSFVATLSGSCGCY